MDHPKKRPIQIDLTSAEFEALRSLVFHSFGINLSAHKKTIVEKRLARLLKETNFKTFTEFFAFVKSDTSGETLSKLINNITTNYTYFFREIEHYDFFKERALPEILNRIGHQSPKDIRIWSAGCSSGEEAYSFIIIMKEELGSIYNDLNAGILATDISEAMLGEARMGIYGQDRLNFVPENVKRKYFQLLDEDKWEVIDDIKNEVTFRRLNLMTSDFPFNKAFDIICCRNVMIYFNDFSRQLLVEKLYDHIAPGGYLFIGQSEYLDPDSNRFIYIKPGIYFKGE